MAGWRTAATLLAAIAIVGTAHAQTEQDRADARCILAIADRVDNPGPNETRLVDDDEQAMQILVGYFLGKIRGRDPSLDVDGLLTSDLVRAVYADRGAEMDRCFAETQAFANDMDTFDAAARKYRRPSAN